MLRAVCSVLLSLATATLVWSLNRYLASGMHALTGNLVLSLLWLLPLANLVLIWRTKNKNRRLWLFIIFTGSLFIAIIARLTINPATEKPNPYIGRQL